MGERPDYDAIADLYDVDMATNMAHDDVGFFVRLSRRIGGRILELGCGNGRLLIPLLDAGLDAVGVDASVGMLQRLRAKGLAAGRVPRVAAMDVRQLALHGPFDVVLCPYSLVTYMAGPDDPAILMRAIRGVTRPGSCLVLDAFIPKAPPKAGYSLDYRRPYRNGFVERSKRITPLSPSLNRIERRYAIEDGKGEVVTTIETRETIRPFTPPQLETLLIGHGYSLQETHWDYGRAPDMSHAQFATIVARRDPAPVDPPVAKGGTLNTRIKQAAA